MTGRAACSVIRDASAVYVKNVGVVNASAVAVCFRGVVCVHAAGKGVSRRSRGIAALSCVAKVDAARVVDSAANARDVGAGGLGLVFRLRRSRDGASDKGRAAHVQFIAAFQIHAAAVRGLVSRYATAGHYKYRTRASWPACKHAAAVFGRTVVANASARNVDTAIVSSKNAAAVAFRIIVNNARSGVQI